MIFYTSDVKLHRKRFRFYDLKILRSCDSLNRCDLWTDLIINQTGKITSGIRNMLLESTWKACGSFIVYNHKYRDGFSWQNILHPTFQNVGLRDRFLVREITFDGRLNAIKRAQNFLLLLLKHFCVPYNFRIMIKATGHIRRFYWSVWKKSLTFFLREILWLQSHIYLNFLQ